MRLHINLSADRDCIFTAHDKTDYHELENHNIIKHVFVEFVCYFPYAADENDLLAIDASKKLTSFIHQHEFLDRIYNYKLKQDGRYRYYKYGLYTIDHPSVFNGSEYLIAGKVFYDDVKIYFGLQNTTTPEFTDDNSEIITN